MKFIPDSFVRTGLIGLIALSVFSLTFFGQDLSFFLKTSIVGYPQHDPFDGTVYPVLKVPDWVNLSSSKWDYDYDQLSSSDLIDIPYYNPSDLKKSTDTLKWGDAEHNKVRNAKITYSVPYMGNYLLDGKEYAGSHLAVDIKIPEGTPVYAIANGTVIKVSGQSSGFGHHIVIQHNNFPTLEDANASETLYSSYSHLGDTFVSEGSVVKKGEMIAESGSTGTATTPHLHFQIDNDEAPWHPFWPFTWQEAEAAGLDFFSAVNEGLGKELALSTTISPVKYVQTYLDSSASFTDSDSDSGSATSDSYIPDSFEDEPLEADSSEVFVEEEVFEEEIVDEEPVVLDPPVLQFDFDTKSKYFAGQDSKFTVLLRDQYGDVFEEGFSGEVIISSSSGNFTANPAIATHFDFDDGSLPVYMTKMQEGKDKVKVSYNGETYSSDWFEVVDSGSSSAFSDIPEGHKYFDAITYLASEGVVAGYPDGTFKSHKTVSRVEAVKFILEGLKQTVDEGDLPFSDVSSAEWYSSYLYTAYSNGVVNGYEDGTFKPASTVNRAEFFKILFNGMGVDVNLDVETSPFSDVQVSDWYAPYVIYAYEIGIIDGGVTKLNPSEGMSRGEVAYSIYKLMLLMK
jgi:hypothetical protein